MDRKKIQSVYPLSPMQQGMLFHSIYASDPPLYLQQYCYTIDSQLNISAFKRAWEQVLLRHTILRTAFIWEGVDSPLQVVARNVTLPFKQVKLGHLSAQQGRQQLEQLLRDDRLEGFDFGKPPLMRLMIVELLEESYEFIWSFHHLLLDGWSLSLVIEEVFQEYESELAFEEVNEGEEGEGEEGEGEEDRYERYIEWLEKQDMAEAEKYWRKRLEGFRSATALGIDRARAKEMERDQRYEQEGQWLSREATGKLAEIARRNRMTMSTLVHGAWAIVLSRYSGQEDVVYGAVVSGRPGELAGVERMVGLFINTLPMRVQVRGKSTVSDWLKRLQEELAEARQYEYCPLVQVQGWSEVPKGQPLFETILAFENYPVLTAQADSAQREAVSQSRVVERTSYPISVAVSPGEGLVMNVLYDASRFEGSAILRLAAHFKSVLECFATNAHRRVAECDLLTEGE